MHRKTNSIKLEVSNGDNIVNNNISSQKIKLSVRIMYAVNLVSEDGLQKVSRKTLEVLSEYLIGTKKTFFFEALQRTISSTRASRTRSRLSRFETRCGVQTEAHVSVIHIVRALYPQLDYPPLTAK